MFWLMYFLLESAKRRTARYRSEEHTSELQSRSDLVCRLLLEKKKNKTIPRLTSDDHLRELAFPAYPAGLPIPLNSRSAFDSLALVQLTEEFSRLCHAVVALTP